MESFFRVIFLVLFSILKKNKISGDSNFFFQKSIFHKNKKKASLADRVGMHVKNSGPHQHADFLISEDNS